MLRLRSAYSLFSGDIIQPDGQFYADGRKDPKHQVSLWSQFNVTRDVEFDLIGRWVSGVRGRFEEIHGYFGLDARLGWRPTKNWELAVVGQNLIKPQHVEYVEDTGVRTQVTPVPRGGYLQATYRF